MVPVTTKQIHQDPPTSLKNPGGPGFPNFNCFRKPKPCKKYAGLTLRLCQQFAIENGHRNSGFSH